MKRLFILPAAAMLCMGASDCSGRRENNQTLQTPPTVPSAPQAQSVSVPATRVTVSVIGTFADEIAYGNQRSIYLIKDTKTGQTFIGISGVGIAETGRHSSGKTQTEDER